MGQLSDACAWHRWFAWRPVYVNAGCGMAWLTTVWRRSIGYGEYEYRHFPSQDRLSGG